MLSRTLRTRTTARVLPTILRASYASTPAGQVPANDPTTRGTVQNVSETNATPTSSEGSMDKILVESVEKAELLRTQQSPNRKGIWSRSQQPREKAMSGPRFEQTILEDQPRPYAAIELIHKQPVRWTHERVVACDGGGGPLGHPKIFINLDKPKINWCTYCGLPFANEHHRKHLESLPETSYPLSPTGDPAEVQESQRITNEPLGQR
ncbi:NADH-ubiquinone oxidoreductase [Lentithecium fluviatile CBS 122367]|uniref:NADH-ubiquinone oxidoreductase n=1 Tax=Lentithecium fluviatile CBS 122367 TaxID=1168545 RepID=A0A6G1J3V3_9PLEO|nr:NADH-ubiquinone oxidoreductase [Lentithecium fluviatile CBS 122367]